MSQSTFSNSNMAYTSNSRPFTNLGNTTASDKTNGTALNPTFYSKRNGWASNSIWGSGSLSNGLNSRDATRDNSRSRDSRPSSSGEEVIEGKTGSGSLVNSSVTDDFSYRTPWGAKRSLPSGRSISQANYAEPSTFQPRSASNAGLPSSLSNTSQNPTGFASRPPTINLNANSNAPTRPGMTSPYSFGFTGCGSDQPPTVYTKFDRPSEPTSRKLPDSAKDGLWPEYSPTDERKPFNLTFGNRTASTPASRDGSLPSSRHGEEQPFFTRPDYGRSSQRPTQNNSRAPSISSQANSMNNFLNSNPDHLSWQLNQVSLSNNRHLTSHKGSIGSNAIFNQPSPTSATSPFTRSSIPGLGLADDNEESDRVGMNDYNQYQFLPHQLGAYSDYAQNGLDGRDLQTPTTNDLTQRQSFANGSLPPHLLGLPSAARSNASWAATPEAGAAGARRLGDLPDQSQYLDFRLQQQMPAPGFRNGYQQLYNPFNVHPALQLNAANGFVPLIPLAMSSVDANIDARALNDRTGESMQSLLMYDFKQNQKTRRYELKDIFDHIAEFSGDQHGSRFIQTKLESANSDDKERVFKEIEPNAIQLMTDVFGNYVIQKFFEHGDQRHKKILANKMKGEVLNLSLQMYGCRVVQKALDHVLVDQQHELVCELEGNVLKCVKDQNGNHVIQKAIERCQPGSIRFIIQAFRGEVQHLSIHPYGCRVIQRCLERCEPTMKAMIMEELMACVDSLICDQFGNYVVQHVLEHDEGHGKNLVLDIVARSLEAYSKHKFASNVVEDCLTYSNEDWRRKAVMILASGHPQRSEGEGVFVSLIKDNYGNYVIQRLLETLPPDDYVQFVDLLHPALLQAKRTGCGKQVVAIEKKMHRLPSYRGGPTNGGAYNPHAFRLPVPPFANPIDSATTTPPPLTADTRSLQSSALQSIDGDAVEGAAAICNSKGANHSPAGFYQ